MPKFKLYLESIHYTGRNIGDDIHVSVRALSQTYTLDFQLRVGQKKSFEPLEFIAEGDFDPEKDELRRKISITVIEIDPKTNDKAKNNAFHSIPIVLGSQFKFSQSVEVTEDNRLNEQKNKGRFTFTFVAVFPLLEEEIREGMRLPILTPPILQQSKPKYLSWNCDPICLLKCPDDDWLCVLNCCTRKTSH